MSLLAPSLFLAIIGAVFLWIAARLHFFRLKELPPVATNLRYPLLGVIGYLLLFFIVAPFTIRLMGNTLRQFAAHSPILLMTLFQIISLAWVMAYLVFLCAIQDKITLHALWIHPKRTRFSCILEDFGLGILTCVLVYPIIGVVSQVVEFLIYVLTKTSPVDQVAVRYLKMAKQSPFLLSIALITILIIAPLVEELVFRGFLYSYFRKKGSIIKGASLSSLIFALFHFSPEQGMSNISLFASLFILALFLAFLYERQRSLFAPIALHMTFNSISVIRIFLISN
ncbi:MAG: CPBP family intramembrane metalloprotease [Chlamydiia bacterium]|nr:CPBP family intramembrane metalloprotease [Chlamydiia bacterium]